MARPLKVTIKETVKELEKRLSKSITAREKERIMMLYLLKIRRVSSRKELAKLLVRDESTITRWLQSYRSGGLKKLLEVKQAPGKPSKISGEILSGLQARLKEQIGFRSYGEIQNWLKEKYEVLANYKTVHKIVRYKLGAKLKVPRPYSINKDINAQDNFKKNLKSALKVLYKLFGKGQNCLYFCQDETRLGLQTIKGKMLTLKGVKPLGCVQWQRENFYLYGAVEIRSGNSYFYEFSHLDSQCFQLFVNQLSQNFPDTVNFLQLDNASFHKNVDFPENIIPIFQPPYSPELNPIERFWEYFKRELSWENCKNLKELQLRVSEILLKIDQVAISSLTGWNYLISAILEATS
jgi:transposase